MSIRKKNSRWLYAEEEDYSWLAGELLFTGKAGNKRTAFHFFFMVVECFVPPKLLKRFRK